MPGFSQGAAAVSLISPLGDKYAEGAEAAVAVAVAASSEAERAAVLAEWKASDESAAPAPPATALSMLGMFLHLRGNYDDAMACYDYSLELNPKATEVRIQRARLSPSLPSSLMRS